MSDEKQKVVYIFTAAGDRAEDAVTGFTLANVTLSMEHDVTIILLGEGTLLALKGYAETVHAPERLPQKQLMSNFVESGGKLLVCLPCIKGRKMELTDLIDGCEATTAVMVNEEILEADKVVSF